MKICHLALAANLALAVAPDANAQASPTIASWTDAIIVTGVRGDYTAARSEAATRTDTALIEVPQSVQVITRRLITDQDRRTLGEALVNVSGVTPTRSDEILFIPPILRGFPERSILMACRFSQVNKAYDPTSLVGVARIEVLKGPSATLYGGGLGTPLGASSMWNPNVRTTRPVAM
jgi:iron complex outermembrane receptor protein